ncbi:site-specific DNA-methyltransferase [Verminephrobacter aporrectodeae]|uniref:site-specific DNA-methyltransferase n=1 Tax=Verminephrobacter aporrectodeae TaxID=1110389 RepID=UPI0022431052|nr:site-specific DNA-methyltransferase [Verminephrobacter aporrectodeae]
MEKMKMHSMNISNSRIHIMEKLFPGCITEIADAHGNISKAIDFDLFRQEFNSALVEGQQERYQISWPGKQQALLTANAPIVQTLRPQRSESVDFDSTKNIYIEGDNLDALKLLQETYLGKIGLIYIDPPYNTGKDFVYRDDFSEKSRKYLIKSSQRDDEGQRYVSNPESNGRFHSDWLSMMYSRIKLSRSLLDDHGVLFVSINDKEIHNLRKVIDEIYGASNFVACLIWDKNHSAQAGIFKAYHEYILVYAKDIEYVETPSSENADLFEAGAMKRESSRHPMTEFTFPSGVRFNAPHGTELKNSWGEIEKVELVDGSMVCEYGKTKDSVTLRAAFTQKNQMQQYFYGDKSSLMDSRGQKIVEFYFTSSGKIKIVKSRGVETPRTTLKDYGTQGSISTELASLFGIDQSPIDNPKPVAMIKDFIRWFTEPTDIVLDFFSGSATTAQSVLELNADSNSSRRFIMVQLPEVCDTGSPAERSGYSTIAELGKERIRKAGIKIIKKQS